MQSGLVVGVYDARDVAVDARRHGDAGVRGVRAGHVRAVPVDARAQGGGRPRVFGDAGVAAHREAETPAVDLDHRVPARTEPDRLRAVQVHLPVHHPRAVAVHGEDADPRTRHRRADQGERAGAAAGRDDRGEPDVVLGDRLGVQFVPCQGQLREHHHSRPRRLDRLRVCGRVGRHVVRDAARLRDGDDEL